MHTIRIPSRPVHPAPAPKPPRRRSWKKLVLLIILIATISTVALFRNSEAAYNPFIAIWQEIDKIKGRMNRIYSDGLKIKNDEVKGREIQNNSITSRKIKNRSVESQDLKSKIISSLRLIADNLITSEKIRNFTLRNEDIALNAGIAASKLDLTGLREPTDDSDAATKGYVDSQVGSGVQLDGEGNLDLGSGGLTAEGITANGTVTIGSTKYVSTLADLAAAEADSSVSGIRLNGEVVHTTDTVLTKPLTIGKGAMLKPANGVTVTINKLAGSPGAYQWIDTSDGGKVEFADGSTNHLQVYWWGENTIPGTTDMTKAIRDANNAKADNVEVLFMAENYLISGTVLFSGDYKKIKGVPGTTITLAPNANCNMISIDRPNTHLAFESIIFDGNGSNQGAGDWDIMFTGGTDTGSPDWLTVKDCEFRNADHVSMNIESGDHALIDHCHFSNSGYGHIRWHGGDRSTISNSTFDGFGSYMAISLDGKNNVVTKNVFRNGTSGAAFVRFVPDGTNPVYGNIITENSFLGTYPTVVDDIGVSFDDATYNYNNTISDNMFEAIGVCINGGAPHASVNRNEFVNVGRVWYPSTVNYLTFQNNKVYGSASGLRLKYSEHSDFSENTFYGCTTSAIMFEGSSNCSVINNDFINCGTAADNTHPVIRLELEGTTESTSNIIALNRVSSDQANTPSYFIQGTGTPASNKIVDNTVANVHAFTTGLGVTDKIQRNLGYKTEASGSGTIANGSTTVDISHGLAATPTRVIVTATNISTNDIRYAVTSTGSGTFTVSLSGDPGANGFAFNWLAIRGEW